MRPFYWFEPSIAHHYTCMSSNKTFMPRTKLASFSILLLTSLLSGCMAGRSSTLQETSHALTVVAAGDTNGYNTMATEDQLRSVSEFISGKDIFTFNAEGVFSEKLHPKDCHKVRNQSLFLGSMEVIDSLPRGKITVASLANNHILDCGQEGLIETMRGLRKRGIETVGAGENAEKACRPLMLNIKGFNVAVLAYLEIDPVVLTYIGRDPDWFSAGTNKSGVASWKLCDGQKRIAEIRKEADIILVLVHIHKSTFSWTEIPDAESVRFVKKILDAGADVVLGSGAHFPQGITGGNKGIALLSLGNFLMRPDYSMPEEGYRSFLADFTISNDSTRLAVVPLRLDIRGIPQVVSQKDVTDAKMILSRIVALSYQLGTTVEMRDEKGYVEIKRMPLGNLPGSD